MLWMHHLWGEGACRASHRNVCFCFLERMGLPRAFSWAAPEELPSAYGSCRAPALTALFSNIYLLRETHSLGTEFSSFPRKIRKLTPTTFCGGWLKCKWEDMQLVMGWNGPQGFKRRGASQEVISFCLPNLSTVPWVSGHGAITWDQP